MEIRREMSQQDSDKGPITFRDVADCFSEEEWKLLHQWQKELYRNVMKEIHQALNALGPLIAASVFSLREKEKDDLGPMNHQDSESGHSTNHSPRLTLLNPSVCLKKEEEFSASLMDHLYTEGEENSMGPNSGHAVISSVVSFRIKEEENTYSMDHEGRERKESISSTTGFPFLHTDFPFLHTDVCLRNEASTASLEDHPDAEKAESSTGPSSGDTHAEFDVLLNSEREQTLYSEAPGDLEAREMDDAVITSVFSLCHRHEQEMHLQELEPEGKSTSDRNMREVGYSAAFTEITKASETVPRSSVEKRIHKRSHQWPESNWELRGEKTTRWESGFRNPSHSNSYQPCPKIEWSGANNKLEKHAAMKICPIGQQRTHKVSLLGSKLYQCGDCEKGFTQKHHLMGHQKTHTEKTKYPCTKCGKTFFQKTNFIIHQRIHTGEKPYQCSNCEKSFCQKGNLVRHKRTHTGERPYQCTFCEKRFSLKQNMLEHQRIHKGEKYRKR